MRHPQKVYYLIPGGKKEVPHEVEMLNEITKDSLCGVNRLYKYGAAWALYWISQGLTVDGIIGMDKEIRDFYYELMIGK
jgi:hypothetical protein